ncbi:hypothetical protein [Deinococcus marmoris]|uniref:Uncharacterized protein n=1 Tax=Deinococcus marmoris TaxID=249408 RepID=A0A1U7NX14_9DEIO|nr:hypothetical protein [Deinococcus marmoris]OLV17447.1 hypothetical protein BOO71_0008839 [Deinococcus marmoris]
MPTLLEDLLSRDSQRIWASACAVIRLHDNPALDGLAAHLPHIEQETADVDLGGALFPNAEHLQQALRVLRLRREGGCPCRLYPGHLMYDPERETKAGRVQILSTDESPDRNVNYRCRCNTCGAEYNVEQGEYHYTWWQWRAAD